MKTIILGLLFSSTLAFAGELYEIKMPDTEVVNGKNLVLNGMTVREVSILSIEIKAYVGGLYLEKKSSNGDEILNSKSLKQMKTIFKHHGRASEVKNAWDEAVKIVCKDACFSKHKDHLKQFENIFKSVDSGDSLIYVFSPTGVEVTQNGEKLGSVADEDFGKVVLGVWIGNPPFSEKMKKGLLSL